MGAPSQDIEVLLATLTAAEAQLRHMAAECLPPAAAYRVERASTLAARAFVDGMRVERTVELPAGWSEHVEVEEEIDALLARLIKPDPPLEATFAAAAAPVAPPPLPVELAPEVPVAVPPPARPADPTPPVPPTAPPPSPQADAWAQPAAGWGQEGQGWGQQGDGWGQEGEGWGDQAWEAPAPAPAAPESSSYGSSDWIAHEDGYGQVDPYATATHKERAAEQFLDLGDELPGPAEAPVAPAAAPIDTVVEPAPTPPPPPPPPPPAAPERPVVRAAPPTAALAAAPRVDDLLDEAVERTHAELTLDLPQEVDDPNEPTSVFDLRPSRPAAAAVRLAPGGGGTIVGFDDDDEPSMSSAIALDEASASVNDDIPDLPSGALGLLQLDLEEAEPPSKPTAAPKPRPSGAPTLSPKQVEALVASAEQSARRNVHEAVLLYSDVLDAQPGHTTALTARGRLYLDVGDFPRAISDLLRASERNPSDVAAHAGIGDFWFARKDYRRAIAAYDTALSHQPDRAETLYRRGMSRYYSRDFPPAVEDMERAKRLDPKLPSIDTYLDRARRKQV